MTSGEARGVVGIEQSARAVDDARFNAALNNVHQAEFHAGGVEHLLGRVLQRLELSADIAAIVNPSRGGLRELLLSFVVLICFFNRPRVSYQT